MKYGKTNRVSEVFDSQIYGADGDVFDAIDRRAKFVPVSKMMNISGDDVDLNFEGQRITDLSGGFLRDVE